jgi:hypothetical protein
MRIPLKLLSLVAEHFGNRARARLWFVVSNPILKGMRPIDYKQQGRYDLLEKMLVEAIKETKDERTESSAT